MIRRWKRGLVPCNSFVVLHFGGRLWVCVVHIYACVSHPVRMCHGRTSHLVNIFLSHMSSRPKKENYVVVPWKLLPFVPGSVFPV